MISEKQEDGNYYVLSSLFDLIATVSSETFNFLEWDLIKWIERPIFQMNINTVETMKIESPEITDTYHLSGEGEELVVVSDTAGQFEDVYNFRQFYKTLLTISIEDYATITEEEIDALIADENNCALTYTVTTRKGNTTVYKFYPYSTRRAVVTINGDGEFYVLRDSVDKIINDTKRVIANEPIDSYGAD